MMVFSGGHGNRPHGYTQAGYRQIMKVSKRDHWGQLWEILSKMLILCLVGIAGWVAYGAYHGWITWKMIVAYWVIQTAKNICDYMAGRMK